jgi:Tol biopolymer transport system component
VIDGGKQNLWVYDISRETWSRLTSDADPVLLPTWTPDGEFLAFRSGNTLAWKRSDGTGNVERLEGIAANAGPSSFSADGKWLAFWPLQPGSDLWTVSVQRMPSLLRLGQPQVLLHGAGSKGAPAISPDGHWLAYTSNESGRFEIYVMTFSPQGNAAGGKWLVSNRGGAGPIWSPNGGELFYQSLDGHIQVAGYTVRDRRFVAEKPRVWSETRLGDTGIFAAFDVAPGGKRIVALFAADDPRSEALAHLLLNVGSELRRRTPTHGN